MKTFNKYSLYFLTAYALVLLVIGMLMWNSLAIIQKVIIIATCIVTLHEWEEQRFPGGFFDVMSRIWQIDLSNIDLHDMYAKPDIYIFAITFLALIFPNTLFLSCAVLLLGVFEGFIHIMGINRNDWSYGLGFRIYLVILNIFNYGILCLENCRYKP